MLGFRTLYVMVSVTICIVVGALLLFFLFPRSVKLSTAVTNLKPDHMYINETQEIVSMTLTVSHPSMSIYYKWLNKYIKIVSLYRYM